MNRSEHTETGIAPTAQHPAATVRAMIASQVSSRVRGGGIPLPLALRQFARLKTRADVTMLAHPSCDSEAGLTLPTTLVPGACPVAPAVAFTLTGRTTGRPSRGATVKAGAGDHGRPIAWQRMRHPVRIHVTTSRSMGIDTVPQLSQSGY
jgi:hypothetical protein